MIDADSGEVVLEALDSVQRSTFRSFEIVVVDDGPGISAPRKFA